MKKATFTLLTLLLFYCSGIAQDHTIMVSSFSFAPNSLTINAGESVAWVNQGGTHSVNGSLATYPSNPEGFFSGNAAPAPWTFMHTFNVPGTYAYRCDPHFSLGMTGTITVVAAASDVIITEIMYNNPGADDYEFVEFYNKGATPVQLENWTITKAINYTFPAYTLNAGEYVVLALNEGLFEAAFGGDVLDWNEASNNVLNNTGETIVLNDASGNLVDSVAYKDSAPWPTAADGFGPSLVLCDYDSDNNDPANWAAALTPTGFSVSGIEIFANPGADSECPTGSVIGFVNTNFTLLESAGTVFVRVAMNGGNASPTEVTVSLDAVSTAIPGVDFNLSLPVTITFPAGMVNDTQTVSIGLIDDTDIEDIETVILNLTNPTNGGTVAPSAAQFTLNILDNDAPQTNSMVITGVFDTQVESGGTWAKGAEFKAIQDIPDLSVFGVGFANNGGGTDGIEVMLPAISLTAGQCIWVANDSTLFANFFGFPPTVASNAASINGDDAIELFENNIVIDVFGEITHSGGTLPWSYLDGWAYRKNGSGPDGSTFVIGNWTFSGENAFDLVPNNASALNPFPVCTYSAVAPNTAVANDDNPVTAFNTAITINVLGNDVLPNPLTSMTVTSDPANGTAIVNDLNNITYTANTDFCGTDVFTYEICDAVGCDEATVTVTVQCPVSYPAYDIANVTTVNANGQPDSLGRTCQLQGIVYGIDFRGGTGLQFTVKDATGGINVFNSSKEFGYAVTEGDEIIIQGKIDQFSCLTEIIPDTLWLVSTGNDLDDPVITTFLNESFESELIELTNLTLVNPAQWTGAGPGFNVEVTNGTFTNIMRIDNDCELFSMPAPAGTFHARGIGGQFDTAPCDDGYQLFPRYAADIIPLDGASEELLGEKIKIYPNPVGSTLFIQSEIIIDDLIVANTLGQQLIRVKNPGNRLEVGSLNTGVYLVTFRAGEAVWTSKFVKK